MKPPIESHKLAQYLNNQYHTLKGKKVLTEVDLGTIQDLQDVGKLATRYIQSHLDGGACAPNGPPPDRQDVADAAESGVVQEIMEKFKRLLPSNAVQQCRYDGVACSAPVQGQRL
jgi:hypothetical protein